MKMNLFIVLSIFIATNLTAANINVINHNTKIDKEMSSDGVTVDEVLVESSLRIKPKERTQLRRVRRSILNNYNILNSLAEHRRVKRQFGQSQFISNDAAHQNYDDLNEFDNSAAFAQAQGLNAQGPPSELVALNGKSYSAQDSAASTHGLTFNLPNGQSVNFASKKSFASGPDANNSRRAVSVNRI